MSVLSAVNFSLCCFSYITHILICCIFIFIQFNVLFFFVPLRLSLTYGLIRNVLFSSQMWTILCYLFSISSLIPLCSENIECVISVLLNHLRFVLWVTILSLLVYIFHSHLKIICILLFGGVFYKSLLDCVG